MSRSNGVSTQESCGYQLLSLSVGNPEFLGSLFTLLEIPNSQVYKAINDEAFTNTMNELRSLGDSENGYGICYKTMDALFSAFAAYPWFASTSSTSPDTDTVVPVHQRLMHFRQ